MVSLPMSPVPSDCGSIASEDLEALLEAQGSLSHWPTPPTAEDELHDVDAHWDSEEDALDCKVHCLAERQPLIQIDDHVSHMFIHKASLEENAVEIHTDFVKRILFRARLPPEVLAIAFNILKGLENRFILQESLESTPGDLLVVSALSLAVTYALDCPPSLSYWSRKICDSRWSTSQIDQTVLRMLSALGWRLRDFYLPKSIENAKAILRFSNAAIRFRRDSLTSEQEWSFCSEGQHIQATSAPQLKGVDEDGDRSSCWFNAHVAPHAVTSGHDSVDGSSLSHETT